MPKKDVRQPETRPMDAGTRQVLWTALFLLFAAYAVVFIYNTSFVIDGVRYFSLFDDAMVAMKYGRNLAQGHGLLWNPGQPPVEGVTDPLWVFFMALLHLLPIPVSKMSLLVQAASAVLLLLNLLVVRRIAERLSDKGFPAVFFSVVLVAFYYPLNDWSLQGMEVGLLTLVVSSAILLALRSSRATRSLNLLYLLLGAATLIRMDAAVVCVSICLCLAWKETEHRRRHLLVGFAWLAVFLALQTLARWIYFGELLPNTYYLKMVGYPAAGRIARGLEVAGQLLMRMNPLLVIATLIVVWNERRKELYLLSSVILGQVAYSIYVGGDAWEATQGANRYISIAMPLFFVLFSHSVFTLATHLKKDQWKKAVLTAVLPLSLLAFNWRTGPDSVREWLLLRPPEHVADNEHWVRTALQLKEITAPDATIAIVWAGAIPYFSERNCVDMWGKNDKWIARLPMRRLDTGFYPGHMKWDYAYSIGKLHPDVIAQIWMNREEAFPFVQAQYLPLDTDGLSVSLRKDSERIRWQKVQELVRMRNAERGMQN